MSFLHVHRCLCTFWRWTNTAIVLSCELVSDSVLPKDLLIDRRAENRRKHGRNVLLNDHILFLFVWVLTDEYLCLSRMRARPVLLAGIARSPIFAQIALQGAAVVLKELNTDKVLLYQRIYLVLLLGVYQRIEDILCIIALLLVKNLLLHLLLLLLDPVSVPWHNIFLRIVAGLRRPPDTFIELIGEYRTANLLISFIV